MHDSESDQLTVFIVDDDHDLRKSLRASLEYEGFRVIEAATAEEAEGVVESFDDPIDALLMDIHLPDGWGASVAHRLRAIRPEMVTIFATGFAVDDPILASGLGHVEWRLQKPFTRKELVGVIREAVEKNRAGED